ncbi:MAG: M20/M25/M40 family metallo-hydrolase [Oscillospiraceae bacterium]|nr:M20/M25/M40 family metallo-hydrolase [Oscillospiraceae bacterium]
MAYSVSEKTERNLNDIMNAAAVKAALDIICEETDRMLKECLELAMIPAPTYHEEKKAAAYGDKLKALGLEDVHSDPFGNILGLRRGSGKGPRILVEAHMDTVFPMDTELTPRYEDDRVYLPGSGDDTSGLACILSVLRALNAADIHTVGDIWFAGTVEEEGMGGLGGMRKLLSKERFDACISIDGTGDSKITYLGTGIRTFEVCFHCRGGHASLDFGTASSSLNAAARAVAKIADIQVHAESGTTYCVSNFHAGNDAGIHAIPRDTSIKINLRSNDPEHLEMLTKDVFTCIEGACCEESARWNADTVTYDWNYIIDVPVARQDAHLPIVEAIYSVYSAVNGSEPFLAPNGATNCTMGIAAGIPSICIGSGCGGGGIHSLDEFIFTDGRYKGIQSALLIILMMAGLDGITDPMAENPE